MTYERRIMLFKEVTKKSVYFLLLVFLTIESAFAGHQKIPGKVPPAAQQYRELTHRLRTSSEFMVPFPGMKSSVAYAFEFDKAIYPKPIFEDLHLGMNGPYFYRSFWDRILFKDGSYVEINGERLPLTCVFIDGQDNRFANENSSPLFPEFVMRVYLVANDFSCQGPKKKGWPDVGGREENWDTYIYYEIKDPTIMLPVEAKIRYRWNEFEMVLVDRGSK